MSLLSVQALWLAWVPSSPKALKKKKVLEEICCEANQIYQREPSRERGTKIAMPIVTLGSKLKLQTTLEGYGNETT